MLQSEIIINYLSVSLCVHYSYTKWKNTDCVHEWFELMCCVWLAKFFFLQTICETIHGKSRTFEGQNN